MFVEMFSIAADHKPKFFHAPWFQENKKNFKKIFRRPGTVSTIIEGRLMIVNQ